jgi:hypothetical protein
MFLLLKRKENLKKENFLLELLLKQMLKEIILWKEKIKELDMKNFIIN